MDMGTQKTGIVEIKEDSMRIKSSKKGPVEMLAAAVHMPKINRVCCLFKNGAVCMFDEKLAV
jgi:hypothetical protein